MSKHIVDKFVKKQKLLCAVVGLACRFNIALQRQFCGNYRNIPLVLQLYFTKFIHMEMQIQSKMLRSMLFITIAEITSV